MPRLSCWYVRAALVYLVIGVTFGCVILADKALGWWPWSWRLLPLHIEFLFMGWTVQLVMGVAFWIMPRFGRSRGREGPAWAAWWMLNAGILCKAMAAVMGRFGSVGQALELLGVLLYAMHIWPRIRRAGVR